MGLRGGTLSPRRWHGIHPNTLTLTLILALALALALTLALTLTLPLTLPLTLTNPKAALCLRAGGRVCHACLTLMGVPSPSLTLTRWPSATPALARCRPTERRWPLPHA